MKKRLLSIGVLLCVLVGAFAAFLLYTPSHAGAAHATHAASSSVTIASSDPFDNDLPASWGNHKFHLHSASAVGPDISFTVSGGGLPDARTFKLYIDIPIRGGTDVDGLEGFSVTTDGAGNFSVASPFHFTGVQPGGYLVEAIDQVTFIPYNAILTVR